MQKKLNQSFASRSRKKKTKKHDTLGNPACWSSSHWVSELSPHRQTTPSGSQHQLEGGFWDTDLCSVNRRQQHMWQSQRRTMQHYTNSVEDLKIRVGNHEGSFFSCMFVTSLWGYSFKRNTQTKNHQKRMVVATSRNMKKTSSPLTHV